MKTVLITGASDGIGKACANLLDSLDYKLFLFGRNKDKLKNVTDNLENVIETYSFDATNYDELNKALDDINKKGGVDVLINNMGANLKKQEVKDIDIKIFENMMSLNCTAQLICIEKVLPKMIENKQGNIINILSSSCLYNNPTMAAYTASKKAMEAISKTLAKEVKKYGIVVTGIYPGGVDTNFRTIDRPDYLRPESIAKLIPDIINNKDGLIQDIVIRPIVEDNY